MGVRASFGSVLATLAVAATGASGEPLSYPFRALDPVVTVVLMGDAEVSYAAPLGPPLTIPLLDGTSTLAGRPRGGALADVGLPDAFLGGANGILVSSLEAQTVFTDSAILFTDLFGQLPPIPSPVPLVGAALVVDIADLTLRLDDVLASPLAATGPNQFRWVGAAPLTVEGNVNLSVLIPGQEPIGLPAPLPFSVPLPQSALAGAFSGDAVSTTFEVGVAGLDVETGATGSVLVDLGDAGRLSVTLTRLALTLDGTYTGVNRSYGLAPANGGVVGCGIGPELALLVPLLGWLRRR